jgi:hypothetical protein
MNIPHFLYPFICSSVDEHLGCPKSEPTELGKENFQIQSALTFYTTDRKYQQQSTPAILSQQRG